MQKVVLSDDRQYRYNQAIKCMDEMMAPELVGNEHISRTHMRDIERHLNGAGVSIGLFFQNYFRTEIKAVVQTKTDEVKCECNRTFKNIHALNGHKRTCKV